MSEQKPDQEAPTFACEMTLEEHIASLRQCHPAAIKQIEQKAREEGIAEGEKRERGRWRCTCGRPVSEHEVTAGGRPVCIVDGSDSEVGEWIREGD
jgi:hypothetical protein